MIVPIVIAIPVCRRRIENKLEQLDSNIKKLELTVEQLNINLQKQQKGPYKYEQRDGLYSVHATRH